MSKSFWTIISLRAAIILGIYFIIIWFGIVPEIRNFLNHRNNLTERHLILASKQDELAKLKKAEKSSSENDLIQKNIDNLWPNQDNVGQFIVQLEGLFNQHSIVMNNLTIAESVIKSASPKTTSKTDTNSEQAQVDEEESSKTKKPAANQSGIKFTFDTAAPYSTIINLIVGLENLPRFNSLDSVSVSGTNDGLISLRVNGVIYGE